MKKPVIIILCLGLAGCIPNYDKTTATPIVPTNSTTPTSTRTITPTQTDTLIPSPTATSILPELAMTLTPFSNNARLQKLFDTPVCELPCWWYVSPGSTTWEDSQNLLDFLGFEPRNSGTTEGYTVYEINQILDPAIFWTTTYFFVNAGVVDYMSIQSYLSQPDFKRTWSSYEPKDILRIYGQPSRVKLSTDITASPIPSYGLELFYDEQAFMISYGGTGQVTSSGYLICPDFSKGNIQGMGSYMQSKALPNPIEEFPDENLQVSQNDLTLIFRSIEIATGLSIKEFRNLFVEENPPLCFTAKK